MVQMRLIVQHENILIDTHCCDVTNQLLRYCYHVARCQDDKDCTWPQLEPVKIYLSRMVIQHHLFYNKGKSSAGGMVSFKEFFNIDFTNLSGMRELSGIYGVVESLGANILTCLKYF